MGQLAGLILRYGVIMGNAIYKAAKKGIDLFKSKPNLKPKPDKNKVGDKLQEKKDKMTDKELGEKYGQSEVDARKGKKRFEEAWANRKKAQNKKAISNIKNIKAWEEWAKKNNVNISKLSDRWDKPVAGLPKATLKSGKEFLKESQPRSLTHVNRKFPEDPRGRAINYSEKGDAGWWLKSPKGLSKKEGLEYLKDSSWHKHIMSSPVAATALVGTGASLVHKNKNKKKGT